jgi:hypothetical protein
VIGDLDNVQGNIAAAFGGADLRALDDFTRSELLRWHAQALRFLPTKE